MSNVRSSRMLPMAVAITLLVAGLGWVIHRAPDGAADQGSTTSAERPVGDVLEGVVRIQYITAPGQAAARDVQMDFSYDAELGRFRAEWDENGMHLIELRNGRFWARSKDFATPDMWTEVRVVTETHAITTVLASEIDLIGYRSWLSVDGADAALQGAPVETVGGVDCYRLEDDGAADDVDVWVDRDYLLPVQSRYDDGTGVGFFETRYTYQSVTFRTRSAADTILFDPASLAGGNVIVNRVDHLTDSDAAAFDEFPIYDLGTTFNGLPRTDIARRDVSHPTAYWGLLPPMTNTVSVHVEYANDVLSGDADPLRVNLVQRRDSGAPEDFPPNAMNVTIAGVPGWLNSSSERPGLYFRKDGTILAIEGPNAATVRSAVSRLSRMNPPD